MTKSNNMTCNCFQCKTKVNFGGVETFRECEGGEVSKSVVYHS